MAKANEKGMKYLKKAMKLILGAAAAGTVEAAKPAISHNDAEAQASFVYIQSGGRNYGFSYGMVSPGFYGYYGSFIGQSVFFRGAPHYWYAQYGCYVPRQIIATGRNSANAGPKSYPRWGYGVVPEPNWRDSLLIERGRRLEAERLAGGSQPGSISRTGPYPQSAQPTQNVQGSPIQITLTPEYGNRICGNQIDNVMTHQANAMFESIRYAGGPQLTMYDDGNGKMIIRNRTNTATDTLYAANYRNLGGRAFIQQLEHDLRGRALLPPDLVIRILDREIPYTPSCR